jgi:hypothetical protein
MAMCGLRQGLKGVLGLFKLVGWEESSEFHRIEFSTSSLTDKKEWWASAKTLDPPD